MIDEIFLAKLLDDIFLQAAFAFDFEWAIKRRLKVFPVKFKLKRFPRNLDDEYMKIVRVSVTEMYQAWVIKAGEEAWKELSWWGEKTKGFSWR